MGKPAAFDFTITFPLTPKMLEQSSTHSGFAAEVVHNLKKSANVITYNAKCSELGWSCLPLAVESYGNWGPGYTRSKATHELYSKLNLVHCLSHLS